MKEMIAKRRAQLSKDQKGFTLVEVIVVLVILAILMAIAVPALTGYIDKARGSSTEAQAATIKTALQVVGTEVVAKGGSGTTLDGSKWTGATTLATAPFDKYKALDSEKDILEAVNALTGGSFATGTITDIDYSAAGTLEGFVYDDSSFKATYAVDSSGQGSFTTEKS